MTYWLTRECLKRGHFDRMVKSLVFTSFFLWVNTFVYFSWTSVHGSVLYASHRIVCSISGLWILSVFVSSSETVAAIKNNIKKLCSILFYFFTFIFILIQNLFFRTKNFDSSVYCLIMQLSSRIQTMPSFMEIIFLNQLLFID